MQSLTVEHPKKVRVSLLTEHSPPSAGEASPAGAADARGVRTATGPAVAALDSGTFEAEASFGSDMRLLIR